MSRWEEDDRGQKRVRDLVIGPGLYGSWGVEGRYVFLDKGRNDLVTLLQKRFAVDTVVQGRDGAAIFVEEKIVRWPGYEYTKVTLETRSCTVAGRESDGWMVYGKADFLNYAMCLGDGNVVCHFIDFQRLKTAFWKDEKRFAETVTSQSNRTACRKVPLGWIRDNAGGIFSKTIYATPEGRKAVHTFNGTHYRNARPPEQLDIFA